MFSSNFLIILIDIHCLSCLNTSFEFSLNLLFKLYYLHQNICGRYRWFPQIMDWFHDIYVSDHLVILSKCLFKFEVSRKWERCHVISFYHHFFKTKLLLEFHETLWYLIDSLNLTMSAEGENICWTFWGQCSQRMRCGQFVYVDVCHYTYGSAIMNNGIPIYEMLAWRNIFGRKDFNC